MKMHRPAIWFYVLNISLALMLAGCGDLNQNLSDDPAPEKVIIDHQQIDVLGGSDAGNPPISNLVGRTLSGTWSDNTDLPDTIIATDIDGTLYQISLEATTGAGFSMTLPTGRIYTLAFVKNGLVLGQLILDNGSLGLSANYFLVSDLENKNITLG
ncbi:MAG TPA: hypothetical protein VJC18_06035, partial [bacterium]|nr:hypothetical protein [bacterium]